MRTAIFLAAAALAALALAQSTTNRIYVVYDHTTEDQSMSTPNPDAPSVSCSAGLLGIGIKCSSSTSYRGVPKKGAMSISCSSSDSLVFVDRMDTELPYTVAWSCNNDDQQNVTVTGELSMCTESSALSASSVCPDSPPTPRPPPPA